MAETKKNWLEVNGYKNIEEFLNEYANNSFAFPEWAEENQEKYKDKFKEYIGFSSGYYRFAFMRIDETPHDQELMEQIKILWPIWKKIDKDGENA